ncbi:hypothetical protein [Amycolatopsis sp. H20-H5]|uniref:hypothetical protein n=1 Tax=Amycolatopsis sp. H20-H5 TaxID=3046309 RepID=UPI002DB9C1D3|nr:hypothetical protein [Amycolatopsis sp. H20-H5]MEC3978336.1 hypothetical protein [Amycolatopsis sp. H20-H5]
MSDKESGGTGLRTPHRPLMILAGAMILLCLLSIGGLIFDDRTLVNAPIWLKPFKFTVSIGLYALTLAWLLSLVRKGRRFGWWLGTVFAIGIGTDMALLVWQMIFRGRTLHFDQATRADLDIQNIVATGAFSAWGATAVVVLLLMFQRLPDRALASALRAGTALSVAGMGVAILMFTPNAEQRAQFHGGQKPPIVGAHTVGVPDGGPGLPVLGWSTVGGDLRIPHFVGLHALQALPILALLLVALARRYPVLGSDLVRRRLVRTAAGGYTGMLALLTWQAKRGQSIVHPDGPTLLAAAAVVVAVVVSLVLSLRVRNAVEGQLSHVG